MTRPIQVKPADSESRGGSCLLFSFMYSCPLFICFTSYDAPSPPHTPSLPAPVSTIATSFVITHAHRRLAITHNVKKLHICVYIGVLATKSTGYSPRYYIYMHLKYKQWMLTESVKQVPFQTINTFTAFLPKSSFLGLNSVAFDLKACGVFHLLTVYCSYGNEEKTHSSSLWQRLMSSGGLFHVSANNIACALFEILRHGRCFLAFSPRRSRFRDGKYTQPEKT